MKLVYYFDHSGYYQGSGPANLDPLENDHWLLPGNATFTSPDLTLAEHEIPKWDGFTWTAVTDPFYQQELDRRAQIAIQQAEQDELVARQEKIDAYSNFQAKGYYAIWDKTDTADNPVVAVVGAYELRKNVDDSPVYNGVDLDDEGNELYGYIALNTNDASVINGFRDKYRTPCKKVVDGLIVARDAELLKTINEDAAWEFFRADRTGRLYMTDWAVLPDAPIDEATKTAVLAYRQALRDLPENTEDPENPTWPANPLA